MKNDVREVIIFLQNFKTSSYSIIINWGHKILTLDQTFMFKSRIVYKMKIYVHGLSPLLMPNPCSKFVLALKILSVDQFSNILLLLLRQIEI